MARVIQKGKYTSQGWQGVLDTSFAAREEAVRATVAAWGGTIEAMYFNSTNSDWDWMIIVDGVDPNIQSKAQILASGSYESIVVEHVVTAAEADGADDSVQHKTA
ncbi:MAG: hypothetical protein MB55_09995 [marine actinobacterium MedAcidi-G3]|jgi:uncharacterized protein with GYD domain|nr:MAG: hypothetical protein MB55_09995 [marine actinobacterium MedAcidi-G3]MBA4813079.1 hypothetical protein [Acidimicrobiales bacterium]RPH19150.1 MAG: hypothetical protein CBE30_000870 [Actinobacteria bacterium TMED270]HCJ85530.1 hypothetical protein [Acidimicrobiaceae bacterium]|tara:strand:- start:11429 stop:11743 length:315 start_codon:yes stop_codon:yes gene_type:complete